MAFSGSSRRTARTTPGDRGAISTSSARRRACGSTRPSLPHLNCWRCRIGFPNRKARWLGMSEIDCWPFGAILIFNQPNERKLMGAPGQPKTGGRQKGTPNKSTASRHAAMARVNEALAAIGDDTLTGMKLLSEVLKHPDTPLDVKIQCAGLLTKHEQPTTAEGQTYVACMPPPIPGETKEQQLAVWFALYG